MGEPAYSIIRVSEQPDEESLSTMDQVLPDVGLSLIQLNDAKELLPFLHEQSVKIALVLIDHLPDKVDAFALRNDMMSDFSDIPVVLHTDIFLGTSEVDLVLDLTIKSVFSHYDKEVLTKLINSYNRLDDIEIEENVREVFVSEANDLLEKAESSILDLETNPDDKEALKKLFGAVHTIKGSCQSLRWRDFEKYTHVYEDILSKVISGNLVINARVSQILLQGYDQLHHMIEGVSENRRVAFDLNDWLRRFDVENNQDSDNGEISSGPMSNDGQQRRNSEGTRTIKVSIDALSHLTHSANLLSQYRQQLISNIRNINSENIEDEKKGLETLIEEMAEAEKEICETLEDVRCVATKSVYKPYPRIVRDLSHNLSKSVKLELEGGEIRIENTIASVLRNSLVHLIRNSVDHGIETAEVRKASGKNEEGTIKIVTSKQDGELRVEVKDDGAGLDFDIIANKAINRGLFSKEEISKMDESAIGELIFLPGFSTSESISKISGRGVGMDMVKNSVESVGGKLIVESEKGKGSCFRLIFQLENAVMLF